MEQLALRSSELEQLDPGVRILLRQARARQLSLMELNMGLNPVEMKIFRDLQAQLDDSRDRVGTTNPRVLGYRALKRKLVGAVREKHSKIGESRLRKKAFSFLRMPSETTPLMAFVSSTSSFQ